MSNDPLLHSLLERCQPFVELEHTIDALAKSHNAVCETPLILRQVLIKYANCEKMEWVGEPRYWEVDPNTMLCVRCGKSVLS